MTSVSPWAVVVSVDNDLVYDMLFSAQLPDPDPPPRQTTYTSLYGHTAGGEDGALNVGRNLVNKMLVNATRAKDYKSARESTAELLAQSAQFQLGPGPAGPRSLLGDTGVGSGGGGARSHRHPSEEGSKRPKQTIAEKMESYRLNYGK